MTTVSLLVLSLATADANPQASRGVLLDFTATWCGPCQQMNPIVHRLERQGYPVRKVDVDRERSLANRFNVRSMPTFILVVDGKEQQRIVGMTSEAQLRRLLNQIPKTPKPPVVKDLDVRAVAENTPPSPKRATDRSSKSSGLGFIFPFLGKNKKKTSAPLDTEDAVVRAKIDQDKKPFHGYVEDDPLASSVRVRITGDDGVNYGSGTIIFSEAGRTVVLTCGHIFRKLASSAKIEVDVFTGTKVETFVGKQIGYDLEGDVGLLAMTTDVALPASAVAGTSNRVKERQSVYSIGCGGGEPPSREELFVTALNRYLGPDNIECTGEPLQGRSGGGLFNQDGDVVGVCVAADPRDQRGLYAGLGVIHSLLKENDLAHLVPKHSAPIMVADASDRNSSAKKKDVAPPVKTAVAKGKHVALPAALTTPGEAEVICIVRPLNQPRSSSQVVIINRASSRFVSYLTNEVENQPVPTVMQTTSSPSAPAELEPPPFAVEETVEAPPFHTTNREAVTLSQPRIQRFRRRRKP